MGGIDSLVASAAGDVGRAQPFFRDGRRSPATACRRPELR
jgi:hypothetical protein